MSENKSQTPGGESTDVKTVTPLKITNRAGTPEVEKARKGKSPKRTTRHSSKALKQNDNFKDESLEIIIDEGAYYNTPDNSEDDMNINKSENKENLTAQQEIETKNDSCKTDQQATQQEKDKEKENKPKPKPLNRDERDLIKVIECQNKDLEAYEAKQKEDAATIADLKRQLREAKNDKKVTKLEKDITNLKKELSQSQENEINLLKTAQEAKELLEKDVNKHDDLTADIIKLEEENSNLKREVALLQSNINDAQLKAKIENLTETNRELKRENESRDHCIKSLESGFKEAREQLQEEKESRTEESRRSLDLENKILDLESKLRDSDKKIAESKEENMEKKIQIQTLTVEKRHLEEKAEAIADPSQERVAKLQDKVKELNEDIRALQEQLMENERTTGDQPDVSIEEIATHEEITVVIIADSNRDNFREFIKDTESTKFKYIEYIYTAERLEDKAKEIAENYQPGTQYSILMGLNDLRKLKQTRTVNEHIENATATLRSTGAIVQILPIPIHRDVTINAKIAHVNNFIEDLGRKDKGVIFNKIEEFTEMTKEDFLQKDHDFHFGKLAGEAYAKEIKRVWNQDMSIYETETEPNTTGLIIGKEGRNLKKLKEETRTEISIQEMNGKSKITVRGKAADVRKAKEDIERNKMKGRNRKDAENERESRRSSSRRRENTRERRSEGREARKSRDRSDRDRRERGTTSTYRGDRDSWRDRDSRDNRRREERNRTRDDRYRRDDRDRRDRSRSHHRN